MIALCSFDEVKTKLKVSPKTMGAETQVDPSIPTFLPTPIIPASCIYGTSSWSMASLWVVQFYSEVWGERMLREELRPEEFGMI